MIGYDYRNKDKNALFLNVDSAVLIDLLEMILVLC